MDAQGERVRSPALRLALAWSTRRARQAWQRVRLTQLLTVSLGAGLALAVVAFFYGPAASLLPWWLGLTALAAVGVLVLGATRQWSAAQRAQWVDRAGGWPDEVLALTEAGDRDDFWARQLRARVEADLASPGWQEGWKIHWPAGARRRLALWMATALVLMLQSMAWSAAMAPVPPDAALEARLAAVEEMVERWEQEPPPTVDEQTWEETVARMRERLAETEEKLTEKELLMTLSDLEAQLEALAAREAEESLAREAEAVAAALEQLAGMEAAAEAMRERDFAEAAERMRQTAQNLEESPPQELAKDREQARRELERARDRTKANQQASEALEQMAQASNRNDSQQMAEAARQLSEASERQGQRSQGQQQLAQMMQQLDEQREGEPSETPGAGQGAPGQPQPMEGEDPASGIAAGEQDHDDPFGRQTELATDRDEIQVSGQLRDEGESMVSTFRTTEGQAASDVATQAGAEYQQYEKLSREAIDNEALPLSHRETIRRYFEAIRPGREEARGR